MTRSFFHINRRIVLAASVGAQMLVSGPAWAAGSNMPWEQPLNQILQSVEGPVAKILAVIIIIVTGSLARIWRHLRGFPPADPDRVRSVDRVRGELLLPVVLLVRWRGAGVMDESESPSQASPCRCIAR